MIKVHHGAEERKQGGESIIKILGHSGKKTIQTKFDWNA